MAVTQLLMALPVFALAVFALPVLALAAPEYSNRIPGRPPASFFTGSVALTGNTSGATNA
jgi:hypothetical protein